MSLLVIINIIGCYWQLGSAVEKKKVIEAKMSTAPVKNENMVEIKGLNHNRLPTTVDRFITSEEEG